MDTPACMAMEQDILDKLGETTLPVVFDMSGVDYVSSLFLRICMRAVHRVGVGRFSLERVHPEVKKVLKIAGFDQAMRIN
jgi:anti-anti-sigma factor